MLVLQLYVPSSALCLPLGILKPLEECARAQSWVTNLVKPLEECARAESWITRLASM